MQEYVVESFLMQAYVVESFLSFGDMRFVSVWYAHSSICGLSSHATYVTFNLWSCVVWGVDVLQYVVQWFVVGYNFT